MLALFNDRLLFARALQARPFAMLWIGQTFSGLGDSIFYIALAWQVLLMTHSGTTMGIVLVASTIPSLIFTLFGGVAADRLPRRLIILWSDGGRGLVVLLISILGFTGHLQFWHLVVQSLLFGVVDGFFTPAILSITPDLVEKDDLTSANALNSISETLTRLIGPLIGAVLIALITPMGVFALNGLSFFVSVAFLLTVQIPERHIQPVLEPVGEPEGELALVAGGSSGAEAVMAEERMQGEEQKEKQSRGFKGVIADVREGFVYVRRSRWLWVSIVCLSIGNMAVIGPRSVAMPKLVHDVYGQGAWLLGTIGSAGAIGSLAALVLVGQTRHLKRRGLISYLSLIPTGIGFVLLGLPWSPLVFFVVGPLVNALFSFSVAFFNTNWFTIMQEMIPSNKMGRVISLDMLGSFALIPVSQALAGVLTDRLGPAMVFILGGSLALVANLLPLIVREVRDMK